MARKKKIEEKPSETPKKAQAAKAPKPVPSKPAPKPVPPKPAPVPVPPKPAPVPVIVHPRPAPAPVAPRPTREELVVSIGQQLLGRPNVSQNNGARAYDAQGRVILEHGVDFVHMCLTTDDPAYRAMVEGAVRVEVFAR